MATWTEETKDTTPVWSDDTRTTSSTWTDTAGSTAPTYTDESRSGLSDCFILKEDGDYLLIETGFKFLIQRALDWAEAARATATVWVEQIRS